MNITQFEDLSPENQALCAPHDRSRRRGPSVRCGVSNYTVGGPGFVNDSSLDRYQGKAIGTLLLNALGHHVIKAGVDVEVMRYDQKKAYTGGVFWRDIGGGDLPDLPSLRLPHRPGHRPEQHRRPGLPALGLDLAGRRRLHPGQLEPPRRGHRQRRRSLRPAGADRRRRPHRDLPPEPVVAAHRPHLRLHPRGSVEGVRELRPLLRADPARHGRPSVPGRASARQPTPPCDPTHRPGTNCLDPAQQERGIGGDDRPEPLLLGHRWRSVDRRLEPQAPVVRRVRRSPRVRGLLECPRRRQLHQALHEQRHRGHEPRRRQHLLHRQPGPRASPRTSRRRPATTTRSRSTSTRTSRTSGSPR